ncbi:MAG: Gfo/Idh/MocA family oxidoreductase [Candidatus Hydrogenedentes bacterium]|nr:Gfo/Idh/MocA family oxidoreductase [Candidatus Hydrogenedentota bacterium]
MRSVGLGLIGAGGWGAMHARTYAAVDGARLYGVADPAVDRARALAEPYQARAYADYHELLKDDRIEAVSIVTPDFAHEEPILAAARAGKHILAEKPLAMTVEACERILEVVEKAGVKLMVDFHARWSPPLYKARDAIRNGELGAVQHVYYRLNDRIFVPTEMLWWAAKSTVMWFVGSHTIDTVRWLLGEEVRRVYAVSRKEVLKARGIDTPDYYLATLEFASGATAVIENSWILPNSTPSLVDVKCEVAGSKGAIYIDATHNRALEKYTESEAGFPDILVMPSLYGRQQGFAAESIRHFIECVRDDRTPMVTGRDGLEVTKVICAIEDSVRSRQPVELA